MKVYFFGWPSDVGGAGTKLAHLLILLRNDFKITVVPFSEGERADIHTQKTLRSLGIRWLRFEELPLKLHGWGVVLCNQQFIASDMLAEVRRRGLRIAWSNEMMWMTPEELGALTFGQFDAVLYVSPVQRAALEPHYQFMLTGERNRTLRLDNSAQAGWLGNGCVRWVMTGNYIDPTQFPFREREPLRNLSQPLVVGRLSRPDPAKFPSNFPSHYEQLGLRNARFRVMGWSAQLAKRWKHHRFGKRWDLLSPMAETTQDFLQSLDLFVYALRRDCRESWGRAVVEAMLSGAVPLIPASRRHHLHNLVPDGQAGFHCATFKDYVRYAKLLEADPRLRQQMARNARSHAERSLCDAREHLACWNLLFYGTPAPEAF